MRIRNHRDLWAGIMFFAFGATFALLSQQYQMGTAAKMGPAYFPTVLGVLLALIGLAIFAGAFAVSNHEARVETIGWREIGLVLGAVALFALALPKLGIVVAIIALIGVSSLASHEFSLRDTVISVVVLLILSYVVFVKGLELQFPLWPKFLTD